MKWQVASQLARMLQPTVCHVFKAQSVGCNDQNLGCVWEIHSKLLLNNSVFFFPDKKKPHIKKPLNAFMLYMKEMRAKVVAECTLKESAAINQILGRRVSGIWDD